MLDRRQDGMMVFVSPKIGCSPTRTLVTCSSGQSKKGNGTIGNLLAECWVACIFDMVLASVRNCDTSPFPPPAWSTQCQKGRQPL